MGSGAFSRPRGAGYVGAFSLDVDHGFGSRAPGGHARSGEDVGEGLDFDVDVGGGEVHDRDVVAIFEVELDVVAEFGQRVAAPVEDRVGSGGSQRAGIL